MKRKITSERGAIFQEFPFWICAVFAFCVDEVLNVDKKLYGFLDCCPLRPYKKCAGCPMFTYVVIEFLNGTRKKQIEFNEEERRLSTSVMFLPGKKINVGKRET